MLQPQFARVAQAVEKDVRRYAREVGADAGRRDLSALQRLAQPFQELGG
jgi:hypothetical protein